MVLRGQAIVPNTIRAEWASYRWELEGILDNINRAVGRMHAKGAHDLRQRIKELEAQLEHGAQVEPQQGQLQLVPNENDRWRMRAELAKRAGVGKRDKETG